MEELQPRKGSPAVRCLPGLSSQCCSSRKLTIVAESPHFWAVLTCWQARPLCAPRWGRLPCHRGCCVATVPAPGAVPVAASPVFAALCCKGLFPKIPTSWDSYKEGEVNVFWKLKKESDPVRLFHRPLGFYGKLFTHHLMEDCRAEHIWTRNVIRYFSKLPLEKSLCL